MYFLLTKFKKTKRNKKNLLICLSHPKKKNVQIINQDLEEEEEENKKKK